MSSQGPTGAHQIRGIQGDASNWTQLLKRRMTYTTLNPTSTTNNSGLIYNASGLPGIQSNNFLVDYRLGAAACPGNNGSYPKLPTGGGC
jgi:hypothetical protein